MRRCWFHSRHIPPAISSSSTWPSRVSREAESLWGSTRSHATHRDPLIITEFLFVLSREASRACRVSSWWHWIFLFFKTHVQQTAHVKFRLRGALEHSRAWDQTPSLRAPSGWQRVANWKQTARQHQQHATSFVPFSLQHRYDVEKKNMFATNSMSLHQKPPDTASL